MRMIVNAMYHKRLLRLSNRDLQPGQGGKAAGYGPCWPAGGRAGEGLQAAGQGRPRVGPSAGLFDQVEADLHLVVDHLIPLLIADAEIGA
jgi:hypothetical protein